VDALAVLRLVSLVLLIGGTMVWRGGRGDNTRDPGRGVSDSNASYSYPGQDHLKREYE
jgi:hypothetical protein